MEVNFKLNSIDEAALQLLKAAAGKTVFAFYGQMGAGKTTFINALCKVMGVNNGVSSPTFSIINQYVSAEGKTIYHMDLYRLKNEAEAITAGVEDCLFSGDTCFVEWPENAPGIFPEDTLPVTITMLDADTRKLSAPNP